MALPSPTATKPLLSLSDMLSKDGSAPQDDARIRRIMSSSSSDNLQLLSSEEAILPSSSETIFRISNQSSPFRSQQLFVWSVLTCLASCLNRNRFLIGVVFAWYLIGVVAIVTTKLLLAEWQVPPLLLTFQQLVLASTLLRMRLACSSEGAQPMPFWKPRPTGTTKQDEEKGLIEGMELDCMSLQEDYDEYNSTFLDFCLAGLFNAMDFLASNTAFSASAANFVETIKASDPITTTSVALMYKVDRLGSLEAGSMVLLVAGILLSTWGTGDVKVQESEPSNWESSARSVLLVVVANFSFAFRAMTQKLYQHHAKVTLNEENLLCRLQQVGWCALLIPVMFVYPRTMRDALFDDHKWDYFKLSMLNASAYATYNWASTYVLSQLTVIQHSTLSCLRRLFVIIMTCLFFGVPLTMLGCMGILMSFIGFCTFTHFRRKRQLDDAKSFNLE